MKQILSCIFLSALILCGSCFDPAYGATFKIVSYNVENLFDLHTDLTEYPEYRPDGDCGWNSAALDIKLKNIATVLKDLDTEIIALQEIESKQALALLQDRLSRLGASYPFSAISDGRLTPVKCAVLSKFPVTEKQEINVGHDNERNILKVKLDISGNPLILYVNHWKSKAGPESKRLKYAQALAADISKLGKGVDFVLTGDFNSDYNEFETFKNITRLNDTRGITGINHILHTVKGAGLVDESSLFDQKEGWVLYNLWLELPEARRWSVNFFGRKNSPDCIILPESLYDARGIAYVDNSFDKYDPDYLFDDQKVFRWQQADGGKGRHLGKGYSDHLPVFAEFTTDPFSFAAQTEHLHSKPASASIAELYNMKKGSVDVRIDNGVVIYKEAGNAVIKQKNGRAIYVFKAAKELRFAMAYDLTVTELNRHYGNIEITGIKDIKPVTRETDMSGYFKAGTASDFADPEFRNEVIATVKGIYEDGWLHYTDDRKIRIYFRDQTMKPKNFHVLTLSYVRIGYHGHPEIIVEKPDQVR